MEQAERWWSTIAQGWMPWPERERLRHNLVRPRGGGCTLSCTQVSQIVVHSPGLCRGARVGCREADLVIPQC